ncbi:uncharacterized protein LOC133516644 [Cydia pomonella]|uniref:uncharacterized protein LOC133516644 n=1 Tax=Cydia pomonella TaxID=82600 RepID=UPI002ADDCE0B|nr:uncharacterized protein LOC133516644 [Cydia pomonella]
MVDNPNLNTDKPSAGNLARITGSQPDLNKLKDTHHSDSQITIRKRKQPDFESDLKNDILEFRKDMKDLMDICKSQKSDITGMKSDVSDIKDQLSSMRATTENLVIEHNQFKVDIAEVKDSLSFQSGRQDDLCTRVATMELSVKRIESLEQDVSTLKQSYNNLQLEHHSLQQRDRLHNLEISGIPENKAENLSITVSKIANTAGVEITTANILHVNRVQPRVEVAGRPRNIVVQLNSQLIKDSILSGIRRRKGITTTDIGMPGEPVKIYVNEHLIPFYKQLRKETKDAADAASYKYVWVRNCKIFARKSDKSPIINVKDANDIKKIK